MQGFNYSCINKKTFNGRYTLSLTAVDMTLGWRENRRASTQHRKSVWSTGNAGPEDEESRGHRLQGEMALGHLL